MAATRKCCTAFANSACGRILAEPTYSKQTDPPSPTESNEEMSSCKIRMRKCKKAARSGTMAAWDWVFKWVIIVGWIVAAAYNTGSFMEVIHELQTALAPSLNSLEVQAVTMYTTYFPQRAVATYIYPILMAITLKDPDAKIDASVLASRPVQQFEQILRYKLECPFGKQKVLGTSIECFGPGRTFYKEMQSWQMLQERWQTLTRPIKGDICTERTDRQLQQTQKNFVLEHSDVYKRCLPTAGRVKCSDISGPYRAILALFEPLGMDNCFQRCRQNQRCNFFFFQPSSSKGQGTNEGQLCALYSHCTEMKVTATAADVGSLYRLRRGKPHPMSTTTTAYHAGRYHPPPKPPLLQQAQSLFISDNNRSMTIELMTHLDDVPNVVHQMDLLQETLRPWLDSYGNGTDMYYDPIPQRNISVDDAEALSPLMLAEGPRAKATYVGAFGWTAKHRAAAREFKNKFYLNTDLVTWQLHASGKSVEEDFVNTDKITLPIAWVVVALMVGMPALLMLMPLAVSAIMAFTAIKPMVKVWATPIFAPSVFVSLLIALSIDYGLFMLVRFRVCTVKDNMSNRDAVFTMMNSAGKAVTYSGILLSVACAGLIIAPLDLIRTIGLGAALTIVVTLLVNITVIPSCLLIIGRPLQRCMRWMDRSCKTPDKKDTRESFVERTNSVGLLDAEDSFSELPPTPNSSDSLREPHPEPAQLTRRAEIRKMLFEQADPFPCCCCRSIWRMVARLTSRHPIKAIMTVFIMAAPCIYSLIFLEVSVDTAALYVRNDRSYMDGVAMAKAGVYIGALSPFNLVVTRAVETKESTGNFPAPSPSACVDDDRAVAYGVHLLQTNQMFLGKKSKIGDISKVSSCKAAAEHLGADCSTWSFAGLDLSSMASSHCPRTCRQCGGTGAKAEDVPPFLSQLNFNISREIVSQILHMKRPGSHTRLWDRYNGSNAFFKLLLNGGFTPDMPYFAPETRKKVLRSLVNPYGAPIARERALELLRYADKALAPTPTSPQAYERSLVDVAPYSYLGCYKDNSHINNELLEYRDIKAYQGNFPSEMSVQYCARLCMGRLYFAIQSGTKCFCSNFYPSNTKVKASKCKSHCSSGCTATTTTPPKTTPLPYGVRPPAGTRMSLKECGACGGPSLNSVYRFQADRFSGEAVGLQMEAELYHKEYSSLRNPTGTASLFVIKPKWGGETDTGADFLRQFRKLSRERLNSRNSGSSSRSNSSDDGLPNPTSATVLPGSKDFWQHQGEDDAPGFTFRTYLHGLVGALVDVTDDLFRQIPYILSGGITLAVIVLSSLAFCSVFIAFRLLITLALTIFMVFGMATFAYGHQGVSWLSIIVCAPIMVGLTMDYDMFLSTHVFELRKDERYNTRHSILKGLAESGTTITTAGVIMTVAFAALMLSNITVLNQFGFLLVGVSLVDTFLVRAILVPAMMLLIGEKNWWPGKMPPGDHRVDASTEDAWLLEHTEAADGVVCCWDQWSCCSRLCKRRASGVTPVRLNKPRNVEFTPI